MVVREGKILLPDTVGALAAQDYAYFLAPTGQARRLDWLFAEGRDASDAERDMFGLFHLPGDVPLGELAKFYGLRIPEHYLARTAADLFDERFDEAPQVGDRLALGRALMVVRELKNDQVARVGLKFTSVGEQLLTGNKR